ncbi:hypothetical protein ACSBR1_033929 [Camellia fascicularis]
MSAPPCGRGLTVNTSHTLQRNQSPVANPSMQAHGRGLYIPVWQPNQSPVASPSMQARGRAQYIPTLGTGGTQGPLPLKGTLLGNLDKLAFAYNQTVVFWLIMIDHRVTVF